MTGGTRTLAACLASVEAEAPFDINAACRTADLSVSERNEFAQFALGWFAGVNSEQCARALEIWLAEHRRERKAA